jgi:hypothetical protein
LSRFEGASEEVTSVIMEAEHCGAKGLWAEAVSLLEGSGFIEHNDFQCALCRLYIDMGKSGKAVQIAGKLVQDNQGSVDYLRLKAKAYFSRGWTFKAYDVCNELGRINPGDEGNTAALLFGETEHHPPFLGQNVEAIEEKGGKAPLLCAYILSDDLWIKRNIKKYVSQQLTLELMGKKAPNPWDEPLFAAEKLAAHTADISGVKREQVRALLINEILKGIYNEDCYGILPHIDQTIRNIGADDIFLSKDYEIISLGYAAWQAAQAGIPKSLAALPLMRCWSRIDIINDQTREEFANGALSLELDILTNAARLIPHIQRFQSEFNPYYRHTAEFFEMVLRSGDHKIHNEVSRRIHKAMKISHRLTLEWLGEEDFDDVGIPEERREPVRAVKVGRNEPCPCGSGKKYKKCCLLNAT